jgi:hypothetical protein
VLTRVLLALVLLAGVARADRVVAVTPLSTMGAEDKSAPTKKLLTQIEQAIAALPRTKVIGAAQVTAAIDKAKKPQLKQCEGDAACLTELGKLVGAQLVVTGEVGGLGDSKVIYLKTTDVASARELRSTTLSVGGTAAGDTAMGAAVRLLEPQSYRGVARFQFDVQGATVLVNGTRVPLGANKELALPVGTHAVTVTHPQYHNFVKFVEVQYGGTTAVEVSMKQYPIIEHDIQGKPTSRDGVTYVATPWYRRPTFTVPAIIVLAVGAGVLTYALTRDEFPDYMNCRMVGGGDCTP